MAIRGIEGDFAPVEPVRDKKSPAPAKQASAGKDKVELSGAAKTLFEADQAKRMDEVRSRLEAGYYSSREVTEKIVDGLMDDLLNLG
jgi:hypothetical protein